MVATAGGVKLDSGLTDVLGNIGGTQSNNIAGIYSKFRANRSKDATGLNGSTGNIVTGNAIDPYYSGRMDVGQGLQQGGLKTGLEGALGDTAYTDWKSKREYEQNMDLARQIGDLNSPNALQMALGALGGAAQVGGQLYGMKKSPTFGKSPALPSSPFTSYSDTGYSGRYSDVG